MADHARTQCRDAAVALLAGLATTGTRVFAGRPKSRPLQPAELPGLLVYTDDENVEYTSGTKPARRIERHCELVVYGMAADGIDIDKKLDTIAKEVEAALQVNPTLGGKAKDVVLVSTSKGTDPEAKSPTGEITITFDCEYNTREGAPDAAIA